MRGTLIITRDEANGSIDSSRITQVLEEVIHLTELRRATRARNDRGRPVYPRLRI